MLNQSIKPFISPKSVPIITPAVETADARARRAEGGAQARNEDKDHGNESAVERLTPEEESLEATSKNRERV